MFDTSSSSAFTDAAPQSSGETTLEKQRKEEKKARHREAQKRYRLAKAEREPAEV